MNDSLEHRGPDNGNLLLNKNFSLGHRRLSIIDLSDDGNQPMNYKHNGENLTIVFNGELYNYQSIKERLENRGHKFKSNSDTEVILASYAEWGEKCVREFNGMWAFCIYDSLKNTFFLSRDRLGQKPLYYYFDGGKFIFSSEIKGILEHNLKPKLKKEAVDLYLSLGFIPSPYSIYEDIFKVEAAQNILFNLDKKTINKKIYFDYPVYSPQHNKKLLRSEFKEIFEDATRLRMISDVPLGAFLSGGIDSSLVVQKLEELSDKKRPSTFSIRMKGCNDAKYVGLLKKYAKLKNTVKEFKEKDFNDLIDKIYYYYDEPFADYSMFPSFVLSKMTSKDITVSLSGDGADEFFGGYDHYRIAAKIALLKKIPKIFRKLSLYFIPSTTKTYLIKEGIKTSLLNSEELFSNSMEGIYKPQIYKKITSKKMKKCLELSGGDLVEATILFDRYFKTMGDNFLCKVDRASMANSLEVRSPFLDYRFINYSSKIPSKWKTNAFSTKILMKKMIKGVLPKELIYRKKEGFNSSSLEKLLLERKTSDEQRKIVLDLFDKKIISMEWKNFYLKKVIDSSNGLLNKYKIRLILFNEWLTVWSEKLST